MNFSPTTIKLFRNLLNGAGVSASAEDFDEVASIISLARKELTVAEQEIAIGSDDADAR